MIICQQSQKRPSESATNVLSLHTLLSITQRQCKALSKLRQQSSNCIIYSLGTSINVKVWCTWWNQNKQKIGAIQKLCCLDRGGYSQSKQFAHVTKTLANLSTQRSRPGHGFGTTIILLVLLKLFSDQLKILTFFTKSFTILFVLIYSLLS